jgi:hypothetical protein
MIKADGWTSIGAPLARMARAGQYVEQLVIITDAGDNTAPLFHDAYADYVRSMNVRPTVIVIGVGGVVRSTIDRWRAAGIPIEFWEFKGDYYSLPNVLHLLSAPSHAELVEQVMAVALPTRPM